MARNPKEALTPTLTHEYAGEGARPPKQSVEYAPTRGRRKRVWPIRAAAILALLAAGLMAVQEAPAVWRHLQLYWWQRACLISPASPDVAWHTTADPLLLPAWQHFSEAYDAGLTLKDGSAFAGIMKNSKHQDRLVSIWVRTNYPAIVVAGVFQPATFLRDPMLIKGADIKLLNMPSSCEYKAATVDPVNPSHLILPIRSRESNFTVDGWLDGNDQLALQWRGVDPNTVVSQPPLPPAPPTTSPHTP